MLQLFVQRLIVIEGQPFATTRMHGSCRVPCVVGRRIFDLASSAASSLQL